MTARSALAWVAGLAPDRDEAREWAERELADPAYDAAQPTPLDRVAQAIADFLEALLTPRGDIAWSPVLAVVAVVVVVGLAVAALLIWGRPRLPHRPADGSALLFGDADARSASELRAAAERHAAAGEWDDAVVVRFRALARGLEERGIVEAPPGTTAQGLAARAGTAFPAQAGTVQAAARAFDEVRYLRRPGTSALHDAVSAADTALVRATPERAPLGDLVPAVRA